MWHHASTKVSPVYPNLAFLTRPNPMVKSSDPNTGHLSHTEGGEHVYTHIEFYMAYHKQLFLDLYQPLNLSTNWDLMECEKG